MVFFHFSINKPRSNVQTGRTNVENKIYDSRLYTNGIITNNITNFKQS
jgi:hypothetical protein